MHFDCAGSQKLVAALVVARRAFSDSAVTLRGRHAGKLGRTTKVDFAQQVQEIGAALLRCADFGFRGRGNIF